MQSPSCEQREDSPHWNEGIAYVAFSKNLYLNDIPPVGVDHPSAVNWLLAKAVAEDVPAVDASEMVAAFRQRSEAQGTAREENETEPQRLVATEFERTGVLGVAGAPLRLTPGDVVRNRWRGVRRWQERVRGARLSYLP